MSDAHLLDVQAVHATWTHGVMVDRILSGVARAELVRHGFAVFGRAPLQFLPQMSNEDVREAARAEVLGYWRWAARRPWMWLDPVIADLGVTSMAAVATLWRPGSCSPRPRLSRRPAAPPGCATSCAPGGEERT